MGLCLVMTWEELVKRLGEDSKNDRVGSIEYPVVSGASVFPPLAVFDGTA
jgi:hypothetical protein